MCSPPNRSTSCRSTLTAWWCTDQHRREYKELRNFRDHLLHAISKYITFSKRTFLPLYDSLLRPKYEDIIPVVLPYLQNDIGMTRRLQKLVTRLVKGLWYFQYERKLERLGHPSFIPPSIWVFESSDPIASPLSQSKWAPSFVASDLKRGCWPIYIAR